MKNKKQIFQNIIITIISFGFLLIVLNPLFSGKLSFEKYLSEYSSLILIYLTYIYVLLTFLILNSNNKLSKEQLRPYVIASIYQEENNVFFSVKNYGKRPALNTIIKMSEGFEELQFNSIRGNYKHLLNQKFLSPGQEVKNLVSDPAAIIKPRKKDAKKSFEFKIEFFDTDNKKYKLEYQIDLSNQYDTLSIQEETITTTLKKVRDELKKQNKMFEKYIKMFSQQKEG